MLTEHLIELLDRIQNGLRLSNINLQLAYSAVGDGIEFGCRASCSGTCDDDCAGGCLGDCSGSCEDSCSGSCKYSVSNGED